MNKKKLVSLCLVLALAITAAIGGTMAYFTDEEDVKNTFTVGNVDITLDEAVVNEYGEAQGTRTEDGNNAEDGSYKLIPGHTYVKDPTVTVEQGSEPSYVRMFVTFNKATALETLFDAPFLPETFVEGWDSDIWESTGVIDKDTENDTITYEFRYNGIVDARTSEQGLDALFDTFTLPEGLTNTQVATLDGLNIFVKAEAIQADGFAADITVYNADEAAAAWGEF